MSVVVKGLTKYYGDQAALRNISFEVEKGEVLGFLGPNGAGKTTTMKILTCFINQSEGSALVNGYDVEKQPLMVKRSIGYLPEGNPLYKDMYIKEYLHFVGSVFKVPKLSKRVDEMIEQTGLTPERNKLIGQLSKGYKQRVGLAQALIHDPQVLILDEPTSGLDPNQLVEIRHLIKELGKQKTIIFSTHIMQEVQAICDRVVIINKGEIVADDSIETLREKVKGFKVLFIEFQENVEIGKLRMLTGVKKVESLGGNKFHIFSDSDKDTRPVVSKFATDNGLTMLEIRTEMSSVEDVFQKLTQGKNG
ncbi:gliding motility-associated ABC transporter ATP-binding subunit GldA [Saprospiraceae bacterium]